MSLRYKNILYTLALFVAMFLVWKYRQTNNLELMWLTGKTMGPIQYNVKYHDPLKRDLKPQIDSLLEVFNDCLNTYRPNADISKFNQADSFVYNLPYFYPALKRSKLIYEQTNGAFDPSVGPLINAWGFGPEGRITPDSSFIDSVKQFVGFDKVLFDEKRVKKADSRVNISFSASAKGYGVDVVGEFLESKKIQDYFVEIGGEVRAKGLNKANDRPWSVGILDPDSDELNPFSFALVELKDRAMATSGNYFNYHIVDGVKYGHTISPTTGYPIQHNLLSASVFAKDCETADALATAFMVMGTEKTIAFLKEHPEYDAFLIYSEQDGTQKSFATDGIANSIKTTQ